MVHTSPFSCDIQSFNVILMKISWYTLKNIFMSFSLFIVHAPLYGICATYVCFLSHYHDVCSMLKEFCDFPIYYRDYYYSFYHFSALLLLYWYFVYLALLAIVYLFVVFVFMSFFFICFASLVFSWLDISTAQIMANIHFIHGINTKREPYHPTNSTMDRQYEKFQFRFQLKCAIVDKIDDIEKMRKFVEIFRSTKHW